MKSEDYDRIWRRYLEITHSDVIRTLEKHCKNKINAKLLDVSAGTGIIHRKLARSKLSLSKVIFNDPDRKMLSKGRKQAIREALGTKSRFTHDTGEDLRFPSASFDIILSSNAYHRYTDQRRFLEEAHRCLKQEGILLIQDWNNEGWFQPICKVIELFDHSDLDAVAAEEAVTQAAKNGFSPKKCKRWRWKWWKFYTIVFSKSMKANTAASTTM